MALTKLCVLHGALFSLVDVFVCVDVCRDGFSACGAWNFLLLSVWESVFFSSRPTLKEATLNLIGWRLLRSGQQMNPLLLLLFSVWQRLISSTTQTLRLALYIIILKQTWRVIINRNKNKQRARDSIQRPTRSWKAAISFARTTLLRQKVFYIF